MRFDQASDVNRNENIMKLLEKQQQQQKHENYVRDFSDFRVFSHTFGIG